MTGMGEGFGDLFKKKEITPAPEALKPRKAKTNGRNIEKPVGGQH